MEPPDWLEGGRLAPPLMDICGPSAGVSIVPVTRLFISGKAGANRLAGLLVHGNPSLDEDHITERSFVVVVIVVGGASCCQLLIVEG